MYRGEAPYIPKFGISHRLVGCVLPSGNRPRAGVDVAAKRKFMSFMGFRSGNSQPSGCACVQTEDRFVALLKEERNGVRLYEYLYFAFIIYLFSMLHNVSTSSYAHLTIIRSSSSSCLCHSSLLPLIPFLPSVL